MKKGISKRRAFLAAYRATASITKAAAAADVDRAMHYRWLADDAAYAAQFAGARDEAAQLLEDEAVRRAHEGVMEPVFYKGKPTGVIKTFSDPLLQFLLKAFRPEKYRDTWKGEITGAGGGPIAITDAGLTKLNDDELGNLIAIAKKLTAPGGAGS